MVVRSTTRGVAGGVGIVVASWVTVWGGLVGCSVAGCSVGWLGLLITWQK